MFSKFYLTVSIIGIILLLSYDCGRDTSRLGDERNKIRQLFQCHDNLADTV